MIKTVYQKGILGLIAVSAAIAFVACSTASQEAGVEFLGNIEKGFLNQLAWSPNGKSIAISSHNDGTNSSRIYLLDLETKEFRTILESTYGPITATGWSPDGKQILFTSDEGGKDFKPGIWMYGVDRTSTQFLGDGDLAAWSPLGDKIAIFKIVRRTNDWDISLHILTTDLLTDDLIYKTTGKYLQGVSWSPDGSHLVFAYSPKAQLNRVDVFVLNLTNGEVEQLTRSGRNLSPVWSPNSEMIAYIVEGVDGKSELYLHDMNKECSTLLPNAKNPSDITWSPDGKQIAFISDIRGIYKLDILSENLSLEDCR